MGNVICPHFWSHRSAEAMEQDIRTAQTAVERLEETNEKTELRFKKAVAALRAKRTTANLRTFKLVHQALQRDRRSLQVARTLLEHLQNTRDGLRTDSAIEDTMDQLELASKSAPPRLDQTARKLARSEEMLKRIIAGGEAVADEEDDELLDEEIDDILGKLDPQVGELLSDAPVAPLRLPAPKKNAEEEAEQVPTDPFIELRDTVVLED